MQAVYRWILCATFLTVITLPISAQDDLSGILVELDATVKDKGDDAITDAWQVIRPRMSLLSADQKKELAGLFQAMKVTKLSLNPYYKSFFQAYQQIANSELPEETYDQWIEVLQSMLAPGQSNRANKIKAFLLFCQEYFKDGSINKSKGGTNWKALTFHSELGFKADKPYFMFEETDLMSFNKKDTIFINKTSGTYLPLQGIFQGKGGFAEWPEGELGKMTAEFSTFVVESNKGIYNVDEAFLSFDKFFGDRTIKGKFQDKLSNETNKKHPTFVSDAQDLIINDLAPNLTLRGGLKLEGQKLYSTGQRGNLAAMRLRDESGNVKFKLGSRSFAVQESSEISGKNIAISLYLGKDSIYHPSVMVKYDPIENAIKVFKGETALDAVPFYNSYHNFNMQVDELKWYISQDSLIFGEAKKGLSSDSKTLYFESPDYYSSREFNRIQSISSVNPIVILKIMSEKGDTLQHAALDVAKRINPKYNLGSVQTLFFELVSSGFINYDKENQIIEVRDKVFHYADASRNRIDYDKLKITSKTSDNNATVDTKTNIMTVSNVKGVELSPTHRVAMVPGNKELRIERNRSMGIDGLIYAGLASMEGKGFSFDYDLFSVTMDSVRYLDFFVPPNDDSKEPVGLASRLENGSGTLLIDAPENKSAQEVIPLFPSFTSARTFSIFYDRAQDSSYSRAEFYFQLDKFGFNSLDSFNRNDVQFRGKLHSQDIFEPFKEVVSVQEDYALGFISTTESGGKPVYKGNGVFDGDIILDNNGLTGKGKLKYLQSALESEEIIFTPSLLTATIKELNITAASSPNSVPQVIGQDVMARWSPYQDSMIYQSQEIPFELFDADQATLDGLLFLGPEGLFGSGKLDFDQGHLTSNKYEFTRSSVEMDTADLQIYATEGDELAFDTRNTSGVIDFNKRIANFKSNSDDISTEMPYNKYRTNMNQFEWDISNKKVTFTSDGSEKAYFVSTDPSQDSLIFEGKTAIYDIGQSALEVAGVPNILIGDAIIEPSKGSVNITPGGEMESLENATIYIDQTNKQHVIKNAKVDITSMHSYTASGEYAYDLTSKKQSVLLNNIVGKLDGKGKKSEQLSITKASGIISEDDQFFIDEKTRFTGSMSLRGDSQDLLFKGYAQLDSENIRDKSWFSINSLGEKDNLLISYDEPKDKDGAPIRTGIFLSKESAVAYPSVMQPLLFRKDRPIIDVRGQFKYDKSSDAFIFGDSLKLAGAVRKGNMLKFHNQTAEMEAEGVMNLCPKIQPFIPMKTVGRINTKFKTKESDQRWNEIPEPEVVAHVMSGISLPIPKAMMDQMAVDFRSSTFDAKKPDYSKDDFYSYAVSEFTKKESQYEDALQYLGENTIDIPKAVDRWSFILGKMEMKWDADYQSFVSKPGKVALVSIGGSAINIMIDVFVEYKMTTNEDDRLYVYLKSPSGLHYFFGYQGEVLNVTSDNARFMKPLNEMKDKDRIIKLSKTQSFELQGVTEGTANKFVRRVSAAW